MLENRLVCILACGLQIRMVTKSDYDDLCGCSSDDWQKLFEIALKHNVGGVFYDGLQSIYSCFGDPLKDCGECKKLKATLLHTTLRLEQLNRKQTLTLRRMGTYLGDNGCTMMVMKGQACGLFYPNPLHRSVGDIDFYLFEDYERGNELVRNLGVHVDDSWYKHSEFSIDGESFENHQYFIATRGGKHYKQLNEKLCETLAAGNMDCFPESNVLLPPVMFNALFLTYHAFIHFMSEGLRLKQVLDWVMFVNKHQADIDWNELHHQCEHYKLNRFLIAMNAIAVDFFGVEKKADEMLCESPYKDRMLTSILYDDDYIFNSGQGKWKQRYHIVSNMVKYHWKYRDIAQQSVIKQLWTNLLGFIFKTE